jgi:hypothetical protein
MPTADKTTLEFCKAWIIFALFSLFFTNSSFDPSLAWIFRLTFFLQT